MGFPSRFVIPFFVAGGDRYAWPLPYRFAYNIWQTLIPLMLHYVVFCAIITIYGKSVKKEKSHEKVYSDYTDVCALSFFLWR